MFMGSIGVHLTLSGWLSPRPEPNHVAGYSGHGSAEGGKKWWEGSVSGEGEGEGRGSCVDELDHVLKEV
jgi:hypothetical protein